MITPDMCLGFLILLLLSCGLYFWQYRALKRWRLSMRKRWQAEQDEAREAERRST